MENYWSGAYWILILGWGIYFSLHSILASVTVKTFIKENLPGFFRYYRLFYSIIAMLGLFIMLIINAAMPGAPFLEKLTWVNFIAYFFGTWGVIVIHLAFKQYSMKEFLGIRQEANNTLQQTGILSKIRHPLYAGTILIVLGFWFFTPNLPTLISALCIFIYLAIGISLEEKKLVRQFGTAYEKYRDEVPGLIPRFKIPGF